MRRKDKQISDLSEIEGIIRKATVCFLALCDDAEPYVVPLNFGYADGRLYFHSARQGRKLDVIRRNDRVAFALASETAVVGADSPCGWTARYRSVAGRGRAAVVEDPLEIEAALDLIMAHYGGSRGGYDPPHLARICVIRVDIEEMTGKRSG